MEHKYGNFSGNQIADAKSKLRKKIFFLILLVDPKTKGEYTNMDVNAVFKNLLLELGGLNSVLFEPPEMVEIISLVEAALIEYNSPEFSPNNFRHSNYRKLLLDAGAKVEMIKEV